MKMKRAGWLAAAGVLVVCGVAIAATLTYQSADWLFNSSAGTAFDNTKIEIAAGNARLLQQSYTRTQDRAPGSVLAPVSAPPAAVDREGFNGTLTNLAWSRNRLELGALKASNMLAGLQALWHLDDGLSNATIQTLADDWCSGAGCTNIGNNLGWRGNSSVVEPALDPAWVSGISGGALGFNGATHAIAALNFSMPAIAAAAWVKFDDLSGEQTLVGKLSYRANAYCYRLFKDSTNHLAFQTDVRGRNFSGSYVDTLATYTSTTVVSADTWYHVVGTFEPTASSGGTGQLYVNGVLERNAAGASTSNQWLNTSTAITYFGRNDANATKLQGTLDEVALFNTRLTAAEASALAQRSPEGYYTSNTISDSVSLLNAWKTLSWTEGPVTGLGEWTGVPNDTWSLTAHYHFDEGSGGVANDAICAVGGTCTNTTAQNGWINGGPLYTAPGLVGPSALQFTGAGAVQLPNNPAVKPSNTMTVEMWVKPSALPATTQHLISTKSQNGSSDAYGLSMNTTAVWPSPANSWTFVNIRTSNVGSGAFFPLSAAVIGKWNHIVGTYDGTCSNIYVNGVQGTPSCVGSAPLGYSSTAPQEVFIGRKHDNTSNFQGTIDEVAIYNTVLPLTTIQQHAAPGLLNLQMKVRTSADGTVWTPWSPAGTPLTTPQSGLTALWRLDDGTSGTTPATIISAVTGLAYGQLGLTTTSEASDARWVTNGNTSNALSFDGVDDVVTVPDSGVVSPTAAMTLEAWIHPATLAAGKTLLTKWAPSSQTTFQLELDPAAADELRFTIAAALNEALPGSSYAQTSAANLLPGVWTHIAVVFNGAGAANADRLKLYVNGQPQTLAFTGTVPATLTDSSASLQFGRNPSVVGTAFSGLMDEVAVFNTALPAGTVLQHYTAGAPWLAVSPATLSVSPARYLQYQARLSTSDTFQSPSLLSATVLADGYPSTSPTIQDDASTAPAFTSLGSFLETRGTTPGQGTVTYRLSRNGTAWYYYNTGAPLLTDVPMQALVPTPLPGSTINYNMGYEFYALEAATITELGGFWAGPSGTPSTRDVRLYQCTGFCTDGTVVRGPISITSAGAWAYQPIAPLLLTPGQGYVLAVQTGTSSRFYNATLVMPQAAGPITVVRGRYVNSSDGGFPTAQVATTIYGLADMKFDRAYGGMNQWQPSLGVSQSNPASLISQKIGSFAKNIGSGSLYWQAYLTSNGTQPVELAQVTVGYDSSSFALTAPTGPTTWRLGDAQIIRWNKLGIPHGVQDVKLEYDPDGDFSAADDGTPQQTRTITASTANGAPADASCTPSLGAGCFAWTIPNDATYASAANAAKIRLTAADTGAEHVTATSPGFTVVQLDIAEPLLGAVWRLGSPGHDIRWTASAALSNVAIEYNAGGGSPWRLVNGSVGASAGLWTWNLPSDPSYNSSSVRSSQIRLSSNVGGGTVTALSPGFTIAQLDVTAPAGGEIWRLGTTGDPITWTVGGPVAGNVVLTYAPDGNPAGPNAKAIDTVLVSPSTYSWDIPGGDASYISAANAGVIQAAATVDGVTLSHVSPGFTVAAPRFVISAPGAADVIGISPPPYGLPLFPGITWTTEGGPISDNLKIEYSTDGGANYTCNFQGDPGCIVYGNGGGASPVTSPRLWFVVDAAASPTARLRITDLNFLPSTGESAVFKVAGAITVNQPATGVKWGAGKDQQVQWSNTGLIPSVMIELLKNGTPFRTLAPSAPSGPTQKSGVFPWRPDPTDASANATIRVTNTGDTDVKGLSGVFSITAVDVTRPAGGERWAVGSTQALAWSHTGVANVALALSIDNGTTFPDVIAASVPADGPTGGCAVPAGANGCFQWTVPDRVKNGQAKVRAQDADAAGAAQAEDVSNGFTIHGALDLLEPDGGESWASGQPKVIYWSTPAGVTIPSVSLSYSFDGFASVDPLKIIATGITNGPNAGCDPANSPAPGATGCYEWTPRFVAADIVKVKMEDAQDPFTFDMTSGTFEVPGMSFSNPPPGGSLTLDVNAPFQIQWGTEPPTAVADVTLHYSVDDGLTFPVQIATGIGNPGFYNWTVPDAIGTTLRLRVMSSADPTLFTLSERFAIRSIPTVVAPNGGELYDVGTPATIRWRMQGTVGTVALAYDADGDFDPADTGAQATQVIAPTAANGTNGGCALAAGETGCYAWTVPDAIGTGVKVQVLDADAGHPSVSDASNNPFTIRAAFGFSSPAVTDAWAVNEQRGIAWTTAGTVGNVKLEYSTDDFACAPGNCTVILNTTANDGVESWAVPDLITPSVASPGFGPAAHTLPVRLRVSDAVPGHPAAKALSQPFTVKWYKITWRVLNSRNDQPLDSVRVTDQSTIPFWPGWETPGDTVLPPIIHYYPATGLQTAGLGPYTTTWAKTNFVPYTLDWQADADKTITVSLEDTTPDPTVYTVQADYSYDATADTLKVKTWVEKQGVLAKTGGLGAGKVELFDENSVPLLAAPLTVTPPQVLDGTGAMVNDPAWDGTYEFLYGPPTNMVPSRVYFMKATILAGGTDRTSGHTVQIKSATTGITQTDLQNALQPIGTQVGEIHTETVGPASTLQTVLGNQALIRNDITAAQGAIQADVATVGSKVDSVQATADNIKLETDKIQSIKTETDKIGTTVIPGITGIQDYLTDPVTGLPKLQDQMKAMRRGGLVSRDMDLELGEPAMIQYRSEGGLLDLKVYDGTGALVPGMPALTPSAVSPGLFEMSFTATVTDQYRVVVTEGASADSNGTVDSLRVIVREPKATAQALSGVAGDLSGLISELSLVEGRLTTKLDLIQSTMATASDAQAIFDAVDSLEAKWGALDAQALMTELTNLSVQMGTPAQESSVQTALTQLATIQTDMAKDADLQSAIGQLAALQTALTNLSTQVGTPAQQASLDAAMITLGQIQTTMATAADLQAKYDAMVATLSNLSTQIGTPAQATALATAETNLTNLQNALAAALSTQVGTPAQVAALITAQTAIDQALVDIADIRTNMPTGASDLSLINAKLATLQSTLDAVPTGDVDLTTVTASLNALETELTSLQSSEQQTGDTLLTKLATLQKFVETAEGSGSAVKLAGSAASAGAEAVTLLHELQAQVRRQGAAGEIPAAQLDSLQQALQRVTQSLTVLPGHLLAENESDQVARIAEQLKVLASEKGYAFDSLFELSESQANDVKTVKNNVEELKVLLEVQKALLDKNLNQPVIKTWFEAGQ